MRRSREIIGLPVLSLAAGKHLYEVKDLLIDPKENRVLAILLDEGGLSDTAKIIHFENIKSMGRDAVIIQDETAVAPASSDERMSLAKERTRVLSGVSVYTEDGRYLGKIDDLYVEENTGKITGYDLMGGLIQTTLRGKHFLPVPETSIIGTDVIFVPTETGTRVEEEAVGSFRDTVEDTRKRSEEAARRAGEELRRISEQLVRTSVDRQKEYVIGKTIDKPFATVDGAVIVPAGEPITREMADDAERLGILTQLVATIGGAQAKSAAERIGEEARNAFEQIRESFGNVNRTATESAKESRVRSALGRPVTRVILDENDNVILNTGDIVTNAAIARAREAAVLDILLDSVSKEEPFFGVEERRTTPPGATPVEPREGEKPIEH